MEIVLPHDVRRLMRGHVTLAREQVTTPTSRPQSSGVVTAPTVEQVRGAWEILPVAGGNSTRVTYTVVVDPGGIIPAFVANIAARTALPDVIRALRRWAASPRYAAKPP